MLLAPNRVREPEGVAICNAMPSAPPFYQEDAIDLAIRRLKSIGVWHLLDMLQVYRGAPDSASALIDWKKPTRVATLTNSPTFARATGFTFNGTSNYVNTNYNPSTDAVNWTLNAATLAVYSSTAVSGTGVIASGGGDGTNYSLIIVNTTSAAISGRISQSTSKGSTFTGNSIGIFSAVRTGSASVSVAKNGVAGTQSGSNTVGSIPSSTIKAGYTGATFATGSIGAIFTGGLIANANIALIKIILDDYFAAVGA